MISALLIQDMMARREEAEGLQHKAIARMLGLSLGSAFAAWKQRSACMAAARIMLHRHLLALLQDTFSAWR